MPNGFERFEIRPWAVVCRRVWVDTPVDTLKGRKMALAGMWIVVSKTGASMILPDDIFRESYKPITSAAEAVWKENPGKGLHPMIPYNFGEEPEGI